MVRIVSVVLMALLVWIVMAKKGSKQKGEPAAVEG